MNWNIRWHFKNAFLCCRKIWLNSSVVGKFSKPNWIGHNFLSYAILSHPTFCTHTHTHMCMFWTVCFVAYGYGRVCDGIRHKNYLFNGCWMFEMKSRACSSYILWSSMVTCVLSPERNNKNFFFVYSIFWPLFPDWAIVAVLLLLLLFLMAFISFKVINVVNFICSYFFCCLQSTRIWSICILLSLCVCTLRHFRFVHFLDFASTQMCLE